MSKKPFHLVDKDTQKLRASWSAHGRKCSENIEFRITPDQLEYCAAFRKINKGGVSDLFRQFIDWLMSGQTDAELSGQPDENSSLLSCPGTVVRACPGSLRIKPERHPETQRRLNKLFPARQIGFTPDNTDARSAACEELLENKPNPRIKLGQCSLAEDVR